FAGDDDGLAFGGEKILDERGNERRGTAAATGERASEITNEARYFGGLQRNAVIGLGVGGTRSGFDRVETRGGPLAVANNAGACEIARVAHAARAIAEEVAVDAQDDFGLI